MIQTGHTQDPASNDRAPPPLVLAWGLWAGCAAGLSHQPLTEGALAALVPCTIALWAMLRRAGLQLALFLAACVLGLILARREHADWQATVGTLPEEGELARVLVSLGEPLPQSSPWKVGEPLLAGTLLAACADDGRWIAIHRPARVEFELAARDEDARRTSLASLPRSGAVVESLGWWNPPPEWEGHPRELGGRAGTVRIPCDGWRDPSPSAPIPPLERTRAGARAAVATALRSALAPWPDGESSSVLACMVIGTERSGAQGALGDFAATGLTHLVAISGFNLAVIAGGLLWAGRWFRLRHHARATLLLLGAVAFGLAIQPDISATRAAWMGVLAGAVALLGWRVEPRAALAWVGIALIADAPQSALRPGFQLSFVAVLALLSCQRLDVDLFLRPWARGGAARRFGAFLIQGLLLSLRIWVATAPIVWCHFDMVSPLGPVLTIIASPVAATAIVLGSLAAALSTITIVGGSCLALPAAAAAWVLVRIAEWGATLPGAAFRIPCHDMLGDGAGPTCTLLTLGALWLARQPISRPWQLVRRFLSARARHGGP